MNNLNKRNWGLDLLRVLSMLGIIGLHVLNGGGAAYGVEKNGVNYFVAWTVNILCFSSVNVFAMLTGYLYAKKEKVKYGTLIKLLVTVGFYCIVLLMAFRFLRPELFVDIKMYIKALFPPIAGRYWYIVSYVFVFFMIPYMNIFLKAITKEQLKNLLITLIILLSIIPTLGFKDYFRTDNGYGPFWLIVCYFIGAYISIYGKPFKLSKRKAQVVIVLNILAVYILRIILDKITLEVLGYSIGADIYNQYVSPFIVINAILLMQIFENVKLKNKVAQRLLLSLSDAAFGVYIIHCHILVFDYIIVDNFVAIVNKNGLIFFVNIIGSCVGIYIVCYIIENIRKGIFM